MTERTNMETLCFDLGMDPSDERLQLLPDGYSEAYGAMAAAAGRRNALKPYERELLLMALNASVTLFDRGAVELHAQRALAAGATVEQVVGTKAETMGAHTMSTFLPILVEELAAAGEEIAIPDDAGISETEAAVKAKVIELRGWWNDGWQPMLRIDPDYLLATHAFMAHNHESLEPRLRELIYIAVNVVTTHLYQPGARAHIRNALKQGITADEILEVFELAALLPFKSVTLVLSALAAADAQSTRPRPTDEASSRDHPASQPLNHKLVPPLSYGFGA